MKSKLDTQQKLHINIIHQILSSLYTRYMRKQEKLIHDLILYTRNLLHENGKQILHNGEYQSRQTMKMKHIHYISCFHTNILHIKFSWIHVMKNIKITYQLVRRQET